MISFLISWLGYCLLFYAVDYKRPEEYKFPIYNKNYIVIMILILIGTFLIKHA